MEEESAPAGVGWQTAPNAGGEGVGRAAVQLIGALVAKQLLGPAAPAGVRGVGQLQGRDAGRVAGVDRAETRPRLLRPLAVQGGLGQQGAGLVHRVAAEKRRVLLLARRAAPGPSLSHG